MADIMEVTDQRHIEAKAQKAITNLRNGSSAFIAVYGDADDFGACAKQSRDLLDGGVDIGGIGIRHRLDDDRRATTDDHATNIDGNRGSARLGIIIGV